MPRVCRSSPLLAVVLLLRLAMLLSAHAILWAFFALLGRAVLKKPDFCFKDSPRGPPTANCQPPTANRCQLPPTANHQPPPNPANHQLSTATNHQPPPTATNRNHHQPPTANRKLPTCKVEKVP